MVDSDQVFGGGVFRHVPDSVVFSDLHGGGCSSMYIVDGIVMGYSGMYSGMYRYVHGVVMVT